MSWLTLLLSGALDYIQEHQAKAKLINSFAKQVIYF